MKKNILLPLFFAAIISGSCTQYYYTPNSPNVPLLSKKNEVAGSIDYYPPEDGGNAIEFQTAYAAGNHVAVQINGSGGGNGGSTNDHKGGGYFEGGIGYFLPFGWQKRFVFESYGIFSLGWMNGQFGANGSIKTGMTRFAIQPSIGYKASHLEIAFSLRAGDVKYSNIDGDLILGSKSQKDYLNRNKKQFFVEPAVTLKAGGPSIKGQLQIGFCTNETNRAFPNTDGWLSIGLNFNIYAKKKSKSKL